MARRGYEAVPVLPVVLFAALEVAANVSAAKFMQFGSIVGPGGVFTLALSYVCLDLILQIAGPVVARRVRWAVLAAAVVAALYFQLIIAMPSASFYHGQAAFAAVTGTTLRITLASVAAFVVATSVDIRLFQFLNLRVEPYWRVVASGLVTLALDTVVFILVAFWGTGIPLVTTMEGQYVLKLVALVVAGPSIYLARSVYGVPISLKALREASRGSDRAVS